MALITSCQRTVTSILDLLFGSNIELRRRVAENERRIETQETLLARLLSDGYLRAVLSLIESEKSLGYGAVDLIDDRLEDYMGGPMNWDDPAERCEIIPLLQQLGYGILHFNDDSSCPMQVGWGYQWRNESLSAEDTERNLRNGWTWFPPIVDDFETSHAAS